MREENDAADLLRLLEHGELDLTFADLPLPEGPFEWAEVLQDPYVLLVSARSELAELDAAPSLREVGKLPLARPAQHRRAGAYLAGRVPDLNVVFRTDDNGTLQALVAEGLGVAIEPRSSSTRGSRREVLPFGTASRRAHRPRMAPRPLPLAAAQAFVELAQELAARLAAGCGGGATSVAREAACT